jgi:hypothetical protein
VPETKEGEGGKPLGVRRRWFVMEVRGEELERTGRFIEKGMFSATVDSVWNLEEFEGAFATTANGHTRMNVVFATVEEEE